MFPQKVPGRKGVIERFDCPQNLATPEIRSVLRLHRHWATGRPIYPSIFDFPARLLRQLELVDDEVADLRAADAAAAARK